MSDYMYCRGANGRVFIRRFRTHEELLKMRRNAIEGDGRSGKSLEELNKMLASLQTQGTVRKGYNATKRFFQQKFELAAGDVATDILTRVAWDDILDERRALWFKEQTALKMAYEEQSRIDAGEEAAAAVAKEAEAKEEVKAEASGLMSRFGGLLLRLGEKSLTAAAKTMGKKVAIKVFERGMEKLQERAQTGEEGTKSTAEVSREVEQAAATIERMTGAQEALAAEARAVLEKWVAQMPAELRQRQPPGMCKVAKDRLKWAMEELAKRAETGEATPRSVAKLDAAIDAGLGEWQAAWAKAHGSEP